MSEEAALPQQSDKPSVLKNRMAQVSSLAQEIGPDASSAPEEVATPVQSDKISDLKVTAQALHPGAESGKPASDFVTPANAAAMLNGEEAPAQQVSQVTETAVKQTAETDGMPMQSSPVPNRQVSPSEKGNFLSLERPLGGQGWAEELGERLLWMQNKSVHVAELRLNPAHLGPVEVKIQVNKEETLVHFTAQHAPAREAIDAALPRLREMFNAQQLSLAQVEVSSHNGSDQKQPHQEQHHSSASRWPNWSEEGEDFAREKEERRLSQGHRLLNIYV
ncbi:MAG TPA: flagellar hook-length control protein FliK [Methylothermaceae bacterium]|nr:flagellar hook-length control protein FliK [Methylothermaceae bacterium]